MEQLLINMSALSLSFFFFNSLSVEEEEEDEEMMEAKPGPESEQQDDDENRETKEGTKGGWMDDGRINIIAVILITYSTMIRFSLISVQGPSIDIRLYHPF